MRARHLTIVALWVGIAQSFVQAAPDGPPQSAGPMKRDASGALLRIHVDPRVELLSLIFRLAGNSEYNQARVQSYADEKSQNINNFRSR